ncbi:MAG: histidine--tRNA ligase [Odoribacteraceae bacterium]|nr:histidine--tRNA ligase [Odoribacteraceae bacterium]
MSQIPSIPKGTRDHGPDAMAKREYIFSTIKTVFQRYGYMPLETPAMELLTTLTGKYGDEGDRLLFKVLNSGDFLEGATDEMLAGRDLGGIARVACEKGLRYDLTVPFARFVVQHRDEIAFPFKRYQVQPVWRADRPQKGRYREFYQCDVDVIGSDSLMNEAELVQIMDDVFEKLGIRTRLLINNRKILAGIAEVAGCPGKLTEMTAAIDKLEKIGREKVGEELRERGVSRAAAERIDAFLGVPGDNRTVLYTLGKALQESETGMKGIAELEEVMDLAGATGMEVKVEPTLARGLSYYTGAIFEVKALDAEIGSVTGGGRYDDLTGIFGMPGVSGVGISFGADRIFDVMERLQLFPRESITATRFLFANFGAKETRACMSLVRQLREKGCNAEMYPDAVKIKKQMAYADKKGIPFVVMLGEREMTNGTVVVKTMATGEQREMPADEFMNS